MADYIERQAAVSRFEQLKEQADTLRDKLYLDGVMAVIDALPAANVRENVQGEWKTNSDRPDTLICSVCGAGYDMWKHDPHNFCPNCGARMVNKS